MYKKQTSIIFQDILCFLLEEKEDGEDHDPASYSISVVIYSVFSLSLFLFIGSEECWCLSLLPILKKKFESKELEEFSKRLMANHKQTFVTETRQPCEQRNPFFLALLAQALYCGLRRREAYGRSCKSVKDFTVPFASKPTCSVYTKNKSAEYIHLQ